MHDFCVVGHRIRDQLAKRQRLYLARFPAGEHEAGACTTKGAQNFGMHQLSGPSPFRSVRAIAIHVELRSTASTDVFLRTRLLRQPFIFGSFMLLL